MSKIAIINIGMHGHVNPTLGFTEELVRRGNEVIYFCDTEFASQIERTGAHLTTYGSEVGKMAAVRAQAQMQNPDTLEDHDKAMQSYFLSELERTLPVLLDKLSQIRPDAVVYDFVSLAGRLAAHKLQIPAIKFFTTYACNEHFDLLKKAFGRMHTLTPEEAALQREHFAQVATRYGCEPCDPDSIFDHIEDANLVFIPQSFHPQSETFDERFHFVGPCLRSHAQDIITDLVPTTDEPVILISLGTMFHTWPEFYRDCITAFRDLPVRVVMAVGPQIDLASLGPIPENFVVRPHLPQLAVLQRASLFISHGGMNSTMESLRFGVPLIVIPQMEEQEISARRVEELGLGCYIKKESFDVSTLMAAYEIASSAVVRANVTKMQSDAIAAGGTPRASDIIEAAAKRSSSLAPASSHQSHPTASL